MEGYKYDQMISNNNLNQQQQMVGSFRIYDQSGQADPTVRSGVASTSKFCDPYPFPQGNEMETIKAKIMAHPHYSSLLQAYLDCYQVGAPPDVVARLAAAYREFEATRQPTWGSSTNRDPELDHFMETYYDMLVRYREALRRPIQEATDFMRRIETQLNVLVSGTAAGRIFDSDDKYDQGVGSSEEDEETSTWGEKEGGEEIDPRAEDRQLRNQLLRKYSGRLSSLRQELSKKKKKGKLPKEAREKLFSWWQSHHRWPYPSESEKLALAEATSLDQKQINNWFINQRKRHWKPSEDMQLMVMDGQQQAQTAVLYMDGHYMPDHGPTYHLRP